MGKPTIEINSLSKKYLLGQRESYYSLRDVMAGLVKLKKGHNDKSEFWALKDINFHINQGDAIGIIGRNGAGKSTLLKILSRITPPTKGSVTLRGRVASLLEVGTGFHPELTGRENVYLNGAILGMKRAEINSKFNEIVEFAEVSKFLDTPVKFYSSGMYMRLAFAIAAHLEPEILLVDEVLAVGDAEFQKKCLGKMDEEAKRGRTVLFVSHNMSAIRELCNKGILLSSGALEVEGEINKVIDSYMSNKKKIIAINMDIFYGTLTKKIIYKKLLVNTKNNNISVYPSSSISLTVTGVCTETIKDFKITFALFTKGARLLSMHDTRDPQPLPKGPFTSEVTIPPYLLRPGLYSVALGGFKDGMREWLWGLDLLEFSVTEEWDLKNQRYDIGLINVPFN